MELKASMAAGTRVRGASVVLAVLHFLRREASLGRTGRESEALGILPRGLSNGVHPSSSSTCVGACACKRRANTVPGVPARGRKPSVRHNAIIAASVVPGGAGSVAVTVVGAVAN